MRRRNESSAISSKKGREETHTNIKKEEEKDSWCASVVCLWDYSYRAAEELMRCVIRQI